MTKPATCSHEELGYPVGVPETARRFGVSKTTVFRWLAEDETRPKHERRFPNAFRLDTDHKNWRIRPADIERLLAGNPME